MLNVLSCSRKLGNLTKDSLWCRRCSSYLFLECVLRLITVCIRRQDLGTPTLWCSSITTTAMLVCPLGDFVLCGVIVREMIRPDCDTLAIWTTEECFRAWPGNPAHYIPSLWFPLESMKESPLKIEETCSYGLNLLV